MSHPSRPSLGGFTLSLLALVLGIVALFYNPLTGIATGFNREVMTGGTLIYGSLRAATSIMSVAKDADVEAGVVAASVQVSPGQVLEPVTATMNRMADLLFILVMVSGILGVTLPAIAKLGAAVLIAGGVVATLSPIAPPLRVQLVNRVAVPLIVLGMGAALLLPGAYAGAFALGDRITADAWTEATRVFDKLSEDFSDDAMPPLKVPQPAPPAAAPQAPQDQGLIESIGAGIGAAVEGAGEAIMGTAQAAGDVVTSLGAQLAKTSQIAIDGVAMAGDLFGASIQLGVAYIVRLVVLPMVLLFGAIWLLRQALRRPAMAGPVLITQEPAQRG